MSTSLFMGIIFGLIASILGAILSSIVWGIWHFLGPIPEVWGVSRLWMDLPFGLVVFAIICYINRCETARLELCEKADCQVTFKHFVRKCPGLSLIGVLLVVDLLAGFVWSFVASLVGIIALAVIIAIVRAISWVIGFVRGFGQAASSFGP